jgi:hypothetical protein
MSNPRPSSENYQAYLLRLWRESPSEPWRASLENVTTHEQKRFADAARLLAYLAELLELPRESPTVGANFSSSYSSNSEGVSDV